MKKKLKQISPKVRIISFITGIFLIFLGGIDFYITTIPGIMLVYWSITGQSSFNILTIK